MHFSNKLQIQKYPEIVIRGHLGVQQIKTFDKTPSSYKRIQGHLVKNLINFIIKIP